MPLTLAVAGEENTIKRIGGKPQTKKFLESLGLHVGSTIIVISENQGNIITKVKESRIAISKEMANKIMI